MIVRIDDCKTKDFVEMPLYRDDGELNPNLIGRVAAKKLATKRGRELLKRNQLIDWAELHDIAEGFKDDDDATVPVRSVRSARPSPGSAASATASCPRPAPWSRSATRSASSPPSRSASRARS